MKPPVLMRTLPSGAQLGIERRDAGYYVVRRVSVDAAWSRGSEAFGPFQHWTDAANDIDRFQEREAATA